MGIGEQYNAEFYRDLGKKYIEEGNFYDAILCYKNSIQLEPENYDSWFYLAFALNGNKQIDDAIIAYQKALLINPEAVSVYRNLGNIFYTIKNDPEMAIQCYEKLVEYQPENINAKGALGAAYLKAKNYKEGWEYFENRPNKEIVVSIRGIFPDSPIKTKPLWLGEPIENKILYVYYEGGFGDAIMFARYLPLLKNKCKKVLFRPQVGCIELFKENNLDTEVLDTSVAENQLDFDVHTPIMSLPYLLKLNTEKDLPFAQGYLKSSPEKVKFYKEKYFDNNKFKIGIKWQGNTVYETKRSITLDLFYKLFELKNTQFYSLQKDEGIEQLERAFEYDIVDLGSTFNDFSDTAAAIENLDLIICNDTSVAHLAGAMGKKCWIVLPFIQDWRWTSDLSYCAWYKSVRFFQQSEDGNWSSAFERVYEELSKIPL